MCGGSSKTHDYLTEAQIYGSSALNMDGEFRQQQQHFSVLQVSSKIFIKFLFLFCKRKCFLGLAMGFFSQDLRTVKIKSQGYRMQVVPHRGAFSYIYILPYVNAKSFFGQPLTITEKNGDYVGPPCMYTNFLRVGFLALKFMGIRQRSEGIFSKFQPWPQANRPPKNVSIIIGYWWFHDSEGTRLNRQK